MTAHKQPRPPRRGIPAAGGVTSTGQVGARTPERVSPPARPGQVCECGHLDVLHDLTKAKPRRRTGCSVSSGVKATRCGCREFTSAAEPLT